MAALGIVALFGVSESGSSKRWLEKANVFLLKKCARIYAVQEIYPGLRAYARSRTVFHPVFTDLNAKTTGHLYPSQQNVIGMLAGGYQPGYLVEALLNRRLDVAYLLDDERFNEFQSSGGTWEDNYLWKINEVIRAEYRPMVAVRRRWRTLGHVSVHPVHERLGRRLRMAFRAATRRRGYPTARTVPVAPGDAPGTSGTAAACGRVPPGVAAATSCAWCAPPRCSPRSELKSGESPAGGFLEVGLFCSPAEAASGCWPGAR